MVRKYSHATTGRRFEKKSDGSARLRVAGVVILLCSGVLIARLFVLMILQHGFYTALAAGSHELITRLTPDRGTIFFQDSRTGERFPAAMNRDVFTVFADTKELFEHSEEFGTPMGEMRERIVSILSEEFAYEEEDIVRLEEILMIENDPYEPIEHEVSLAVTERLQGHDLSGIGFSRQTDRFYPEGNIGASVLGFVGSNDDGTSAGKYGIEGYWEETLAGTGGLLEAFRGVTGNWITLAGRNITEAEDGADVVLSIDRTVQFRACERLRAGMIEYGAESASLVVMDPWTGAIRAMCSLPDFDPNTYNEIEDIRSYNNTAIFTPYEPGSVFKPVTMAAAINEELVGPDTYFYDRGYREAGCIKPIKNAGENMYEDTTMTGVLENSINTGMVFVAEQLGKSKLAEYVDSFGFGVRQGIKTNTEVSGTVETIRQNSGDEIDCYGATASFGQGVTATPLQLASAFSVIANGGTLMKPYVVEEVLHADGKIDRTKPTAIREVLSARAASLVRAMLVRVVDGEHGEGARVEGYHVAGKTGTAQIAGPGGYTAETNHSFVGFAPVEDPAFVMVVKFEKPQRRYSSATAAPVFGDIAKMLLSYYHVPPDR